MSPKGPELTPLQQAILGKLWEAGEASVAEVREALGPERDLTISSVGTLLKRLEERGFAARRKEGRQFLYRATKSRDAVGRGLVKGLAQNLYGGRPADLFAHLLDASSVSAEDLETIGRLLAEARKRSP